MVAAGRADAAATSTSAAERNTDMTRPAHCVRPVRRRLTPAQAGPLEPRVLFAAISFGAPTAYGSGSALGVLAFDLNKDGFVDVVSPNSGGGDDGVSVALNEGAGLGALSPPTSYPVADGVQDVSQPYALVTADFNGDGFPDVASANFGGSLSVLMNTQAATLGAPTDYPAGSEPDGIAAGDLSGGGLPDIVVANRGSNDVGVYANTDGVFAAAVDYPVGSAPNNVAVADLNGDGKPDIVTANEDDTLSVLINNGDGTFGPAVSIADPEGAVDVKVADMNKDGLADLVVSDGTADVSVYLGNGTGTSFAAPLVEPAGSTNEDLVVADFNGDGTPDVAVAEYTAQTVDVLLGNGDGTLQAPVSVPAGLNAWSISAGDLNGDGKIDLAVGSYGSSAAFTTLLNSAAATTTVTKSIGGLDPTFGTNGLASHNVGFTSTTGVAADGAQSVLIGPVGASPNQAFGVTRYDAAGGLDASFGTGGVASTTFAGLDAVPSAVSVLASGDILVAGTATTHAADASVAGSQFAVAEYTPSGALDPGFGTGGTVTIEFGATLSNDVLTSLAVGPGGVIYLGGSSDSAGKGNTDLAVARLTAAGALDTTFNGTGLAAVDVAGGNDVVNALAIQTNGDLVVAGSAVVGGVTEVALARFLTSGALDKRFGTKGIDTDKVGGVYDSASSVAIQPKGQILIGGLSASGAGDSLSSSFLVQRYTSAGKLDRSFGTAGTAVTSFGQPAAVTQLALQSDGTIIASGRTSATLGGTLDVAIARYTTRGVLDTSFAGTGKVVIDLSVGVVASPALRAAISSSLGAAFDAFTSSSQGVVAVTSGGEILSAGNSGANTVEAELVAAGVDLVAKVLSSLPASVLGGLKATATITVTEGGTTLAAGTVTIALQFASTATGAAAAVVKTYPEKVKLAQGQAKSYRLAFNYPADIATGGYYLQATVTNGAGVPADLNAGNNIAASAAAVQIAPPFTSLAGSDLSAPATLTAGRPATVTLDVTNNGNVTAKGKSTVALYLSTDGTVAGGGTAVATDPLVLGLAPGKSKPYKLKFTVPSATGTYTLVAVLDPDDSLANDTAAGAAVVGGPVTVS